jgi:hypothetical protein
LIDSQGEHELLLVPNLNTCESRKSDKILFHLSVNVTVFIDLIRFNVVI